MLRKPLLSLLLLILVVSPGCAGRQQPVGDLPWKAEDLRALEAPNAPDPASDMIAAYARLTNTDLELRFDLLGSPDPYDYTLLVLLDTGPGGSSQLPWGEPSSLEWDLALRFPSQGVGQVISASGAPVPIRPRIQRLSVQDAAIVRLSLAELGKQPRVRPKETGFQAYLLLPGMDQPADSIGPLAVSGSAPAAQASVLLAFWDTLPSATPAQALRRWNGAHTGPYGQRHGLEVLLKAAEQARIPVALLDLKQPARLAALESLGGLPLVQRMAREKRLILPDTAWGDPLVAAESARFSEKAGQQYQLPDSPFFYGAVEDENLPGDAQAVFARMLDNRQPRQWNATQFIPLPVLETSPERAEETQVNEEGLTITVREELLRSALQPETASLTVLGGSLPASPWGDSLMAEPAFAYLAGHPWIHVLNGDEVLRFPTREGAPDCPDLLCIPETASDIPNAAVILEALRAAPPGLFTDLAWQSYLGLTEPSMDEKLLALRSGYLGQVGLLLAAARWNANPLEQSSCEEDLDWDGQSECVLASSDLFMVIDPQGARVALVAARRGSQPYQIIGPRSQLVTGLGDRLEWKPELGLAGDPQEIAGGFADPFDTWIEYQAEAQPGQITLTHPENGITKRFQVTGSGFRLDVENIEAVQASLPLLVIDAPTWQPGGYPRYRALQQSPTEYIWEQAGGIRVKVAVQGATIMPAGFSEALPLLRNPENPNTDLSPSFFLPFPMALITLQAPGSFAVDVSISQP